jgi:DNA-binding transcriptional LysR family regulator
MTKADRLDLLETFLRVAEAGALSRAATTLRVSQPSVSRRIRALEAETGVRLIHRTTHFLELTDEGRRLLPIARELVSRWDAALDEVREAEPRGILRIAAPIGLGQSRLVDVAAAFLRRFPEVTVEWLLTDEPVDLASAAADIWIRIGDIPGERLVVRKLASVERIMAATPQLAKTARDWTELPLVSLAPFYDTTLDLYSARGRRSRFDLKRKLQTNNIAAAKRAVLLGVGVALLPTWMIAEELERKELVRIAPDLAGKPLDVSVAYAPDRGRPLRARRFIEALTEEFSNRCA